MIIQLRIDERLTHGQVCATWINSLKATHVVIPNDEVAKNDLQKSIMKMGIPQGVKAMYISVKAGIDLLNDPRTESLRIFVICKNPADALYLVEHVSGIKEVNLANYGNMEKGNGKIVKDIAKVVRLDKRNYELVKQIRKKVSTMYFQDNIGRNLRYLDSNF